MSEFIAKPYLSSTFAEPALSRTEYKWYNRHKCAKITFPFLSKHPIFLVKKCKSWWPSLSLAPTHQLMATEASILAPSHKNCTGGYQGLRPDLSPPTSPPLFSSFPLLPSYPPLLHPFLLSSSSCVNPVASCRSLSGGCHLTGRRNPTKNRLQHAGLDVHQPVLKRC